jgi:hypothetical protein
MENKGRLSSVTDEERQDLKQRRAESAPNPVKDLGATANHLLHLQRTIGNAAVNRLLQRYTEQRSVQRCGAHGHGGEELEVQRQVVQGASLSVQRDEEDDEQTTSSDDATATVDTSSSTGGAQESAPPDSSSSSNSGQDTASSQASQESAPAEADQSGGTDTAADQSQSSGGTDDSSSGQDASQDSGTGQPLVVQENFQPAPGQGLPDENVRVAVVGPGEGGATQDDQAVAAPKARFADLGRVGTARYGDRLGPGAANFPQAFTNGGRSGTVIWAGGGGAGAHGNEAAGSVQSQVAPSYVAAGAAPFTAWVQAGTGTLDVTRSWVGINSGDQGNGHFVTVAAAARINQHETLHVASTQGIYNANIVPLLARVAAATQAAASAPGAPSSASQAAAITSLQGVIRWPESVTAFQNADIAANSPMNTVDTNDLASGTYPVDAGPGTVGGTAFQHRVRTPGEPNPA